MNILLSIGKKINRSVEKDNTIHIITFSTVSPQWDQSIGPHVLLLERFLYHHHLNHELKNINISFDLLATARLLLWDNKISIM